MYHLALFIAFLFVFFVICMVVYILVVRAYYWGGKDKPPKERSAKESKEHTS